MWDKIIEVYPELSGKETELHLGGIVVVQDDSDGKGPYIKKWNHPTLSKPEIGA
jgi:hypothetical protein